MEKERLTLSHNLKFLRKLKGINQEQLALALKIKRSNIAAYETKNVEPRLRIILEIAKFFDINISTLLKQKLIVGEDFPPFLDEDSSQSLEISVSDINKTEVSTFITESMKIKKILVGFKSFYTFRKSKISNLSPSNNKIIFDIDNFIQLMEDLILHNESMIALLSSNHK